jgi:hypothetical protein
MIREEIRERNIQIAKMLGWKYLTWQEISLMPDESIKSGWWSTFPVHYHAKFHRNVYKGRSHNDLKFNSDWNWLMEAVEFIEKQNMQVSIIDTECAIIDIQKAKSEENPFDITPLCFGESSTKKEAIFIAVSDFAKQKTI